MLVAQPVMMALFSPLAGRLSDRIPAGIIASIGMGLSTIGLGLLIALDFSTGQTFIIAAMVVLGLHLDHGVWSLCQTLGLQHPRYKGLVRVAARAFALLIVAGNISFPIAVLTGVVR